MQEIIQVPITSIDSNPFRLLAVYPYVDSKVAALVRSIEDVGLWPSVIARRSGDRFQIAFGHHRIEAARQAKLAEVSLIIEELSDQQMLQYMGRENMEDFNAEFLVMLESWEAAVAFVSDPAAPPGNLEVIAVASLLGWTSLDATSKADKRSNHTARACADASALLAGSYITRQDLRGLSVQSVLDLCGRVVAHHQQLDRMAKKTNRPAKEVAAAKRDSGKAGVRVAKGVRAGSIAPRDIRGQVDVEAYRHAREAKKESPLFSMFGNGLVESIRKIGSKDATAEKFEEIKKSLGMLTLDEDIEIVKRIAFECGNAAERFGKWQTTFSADREPKLGEFQRVDGEIKPLCHLDAEDADDVAEPGDTIETIRHRIFMHHASEALRHAHENGFDDALANEITEEIIDASWKAADAWADLNSDLEQRAKVKPRTEKRNRRDSKTRSDYFKRFGGYPGFLTPDVMRGMEASLQSGIDEFAEKKRVQQEHFKRLRQQREEFLRQPCTPEMERDYTGMIKERLLYEGA